MREKLIELLSQAQDNGIVQGNHVMHIAHVSNETVADYLIANGVTVKIKKEWNTDLTGKCGSCIYAKPSSVGKYYVACTNKVNLSKYCGLRQSPDRRRVCPACKQYIPK